MPPRSTSIAASRLLAHRLAALFLLALVAVPLLWSLAAAVQAGLAPSAWAALWAGPQTLRALGMSLWTGLAASFAVSFAESVAQYLPTVYVGAWRFDTVTTEAVTLAAVAAAGAGVWPGGAAAASLAVGRCRASR